MCWTSAANCSALCALAFGKQEGGGSFEFSQEQVDHTMQQTPVVLDALRTLVEGAWTEEARQSAEGALMILDPDRGTGGNHPEFSSHVMLSYNWDHQDTIVRVNESLKRRMYTTWLDVEQMKGSIMDAMSDAVEGAEVVLYGISRGYKESANCRLEANYAMQQE